MWRWGSPGRRLVRQFAGRWLDDQLPSGPDAELRARLIEQLARQGWRIREADSALVIAEPVRGVPVSASFLRASRLHPFIEAEARPQFLISKPERGVFASMKAVEVRVRKLAGFGDDVIGVDLMNKAFGPSGPLTDTSAGKGEQDGTRMLFAGAYAVLRNPAGHRQVDYGDLSEAAEAVQAASLLMRILDRVEDRLLAAAVSPAARAGDTRSCDCQDDPAQRCASSRGSRGYATGGGWNDAAVVACGCRIPGWLLMTSQAIGLSSSDP